MTPKKKKEPAQPIGRNQAITTIREIVASMLDGYFSTGQYLEDLQSLDPKDRLLVIEKFSAYVIPKLQATNIDMTMQSKEKTIEDKLRELSE